MALELLALAGGAGVLIGGVAAATRAPLRGAFAVQAAGIAMLGLAGLAALLSGNVAGAAFRSTVSPALGIDPLSGFFLAVLAVTAVPTLVFATAYVHEDRTDRAVGALTGAFLLTLAGVLVARDLTTFLAFWELMTLIPATAILIARRDRAVRRAVFTYLAITHLGGAGVWVAVLLLAHHGALGNPAALQGAGGLQTVIAIAALVGFGTKAGLSPLHSWLPRAHPVAPAHLSALMSGVMIKVALYGLIRVEFESLGTKPLWLGLALLALGLLSVFGGVLWALTRHELKALLAYSSVENAGIIALGLGASILLADAGESAWAALAFGAALLHVVNHAVFKTLLFLAAGSIERAAGSLSLDRLGGLLRRMPWTGGALLIGLLAISGLPPLNGFASEWLTLQSLLHASLHRPLGVALAAAVALAGLAGAAAIAALCFVRTAGLVLLGAPRRPETAAATEPAAAMRFAVVSLACLCVALGLVPGLVLPTLAGLAPGGDGGAAAAGWVDRIGGNGTGAASWSGGLSLPGTGTYAPALITLAVLALTVILVSARGSRRAAETPTWACGQALTPALGWTSAAFTKPLVLVLESLLRPRRLLAIERVHGITRSVSYSTEVPSLVYRLLYEPAVRAGMRGATAARRLQTGNVRTYGAYLLALVAAMLALAKAGVLG